MGIGRGSCVVVALVVACDAGSTEGPRTVSVEPKEASVEPREASVDSGDPPFIGQIGRDDAGADASGIDVSQGDPPFAGMQPDAVAPMACDGDASDDAGGNYCPPPLSVCADATHIVYFDWGTCVAGTCIWPTRVMQCPIFGNCIKGACISTITASRPGGGMSRSRRRSIDGP